MARLPAERKKKAAATGRTIGINEILIKILVLISVFFDYWIYLNPMV